MSGGGATLSDNNVLGAPEWRQTGQPQHVQQVKTAPPKAVPRPRSKENDVDTLSRRMTAKLKIGGGGGGGGGDRDNRRGDLRGDLRAELQAKRQNEGRGRENNNNNNTQRGAGGGDKEQHAPRPHDDKQQQQRSKPQKGNKKGRNTQDFAPSTEPPSLKVIFGDARKETLGRRLHGRNVVYVPNFFCDEDDVAVYDNLMREVKAGGSPDMWVPWHENSHFIANDRDRHGKWKSESPIFCAVVDRIAKYFNMNVKATRFNWYRDAEEWKPYHHDAAAVKPERAKTQNCTVAVSFGATRDAAFEHAKTGTTVFFPQANGSAYTFGHDVNVEWRHGIPQVPEEFRHDGKEYGSEARISIIAWGWVDQDRDGISAFT